MQTNTYPNRATFAWFGTRGPDDKYLDLWRGAPLSYTPGQPVDATWHTDDYDEFIVHDPDGRYFRRAADTLMRYHFYPETLMRHVSDFSRENRWLRVGDRLVQRIHAFRPLGLPVLDALTMNEIYAVIDEPRRTGFTYVTTEAHSERGEWSPTVEWRADGSLYLTIHVLSRLAYDVSPLQLRYVRWRQTGAHHQGIEAFKRRVLETTWPG